MQVNLCIMHMLFCPQIASRIRMTVQDLGKSCIEVVQDAGSLQGNPTDTYAQRDLCDHARTINEKVGRGEIDGLSVMAMMLKKYLSDYKHSFSEKAAFHNGCLSVVMMVVCGTTPSFFPQEGRGGRGGITTSCLSVSG